jgi:hypothetical protein
LDVSMGSLRRRTPVSRENRIGDSGRNGAGTGLAHSAWRLLAVDDVNVDRRDLIDAQGSIAIEIALFHPAVFQRDLAIKGGGQTIDLTVSSIYCDT